MKQKLFFVVYVDVSRIAIEDTAGYINNVAKSLCPSPREDAEFYFIPNTQGESKIECLNPVRVSDDEYAEVEKNVREMSQKVNECLAGLRQKGKCETKNG